MDKLIDLLREYAYSDIENDLVVNFDDAACVISEYARQERGEAVALDMIAINDLLGAIGRGWCHPANAGKTVDGVLAVAIASEVAQMINSRYAHSTPDAGRVADDADAPAWTSQSGRRIATLESQLAESEKAVEALENGLREANQKLADSREREGRMREAAKLGARWANEYASQMSGYAISEDATEDAEAIEAAVGEPITAQANQSFPASLAAALIDAGWVRIEYDEQTERLEALILKTVCEARAALAADKEQTK